MGFFLDYIITHKSGRCSYRRVVPPGLRPFFPGERREYKVSIGFPTDADFLLRYDAAAKEFESHQERAQRKRDGAYDVLDAPRIAYLAELFRVEALEEDEEARWATDERALFPATQSVLMQDGFTSATNWHGDPRRRWAEKSRETTEGMLATYKDLLGLGDLAGVVSMWQEDVELLIDTQGLVIDPDASSDIERLCLSVHRAAIQVAEAKLKRLAGEDMPTPSAPTLLEAQPPVVLTKSATHARPKVPMKETFEGYANAQRMTAGVRREWWRYIQHLIDYVRHDDASLLTAEVLRDWRDHLLNTPTRHGKPRKPVTVRDKYITPVRAMLSWAVQEAKLPMNVAGDVTVRVPKEAKLRDRDFTDAEAVTILQATLVPARQRLAPGYMRAQRWIPWLCAYSRRAGLGRSAHPARHPLWLDRAA